MILTNTLNGTLSVINNEHILAPIDSSITEIWLPRSVCDRFRSALGLSFMKHPTVMRCQMRRGTGFCS
jgi:hypothetical protein